MLKVELRLDESGNHEELPPVCMCCGHPAHDYYPSMPFRVWPRQMDWLSLLGTGLAVVCFVILPGPWSWITGGAVLVLIVGFRLETYQDVVLYAPFCQEHWDYWHRLRWWQQGAGPLAVLAGLWFAGAAILGQTVLPGYRIPLLVHAGAIVVLVIAAAGLRVALSVHPVNVSNQTLTVRGACEEFVEAMAAARVKQREESGRPDQVG
jgi:hypothetical protein